MQTMTTPNLSELIAQTKESTKAASDRMLLLLSFVPEDKLGYTPSESARNSLQIVGHCARANSAFATAIRGEELQFPANPEEAIKRIRLSGHDVTTREQAVKLLKDSTEEVLDALDKVTPDLLDTAPNSPFGPFPFTFWMNLPHLHMSGHAAQLDYLQTVWGDLDDHR